MSPNRRRVLSGGFVIGLSSLAGCVGSYLPENAEADGKTTTQPTDAETDTEESLQSEVTITSGTESIVSYIDWVAEHYDSAQSEYRLTLRTASESLGVLDETAPRQISETEIEQTATLLREVGQTADSVFGEHYDSRYGYNLVADQLEDEIQSNIRRGEYDLANKSIADSYRSIQSQTQLSSVFDWFPRYLVFRNPYTYFITSDRSDTDKIFELVGMTGDTQVGLFGLPARMNIGQHPLGQQQPTDRYDIGPQVFPERTSTVFEEAAWLSTDHEPVSELYVNIVDYGLAESEYPQQYLYNSEEHSDVGDLAVPDFNESPACAVYIQAFSDAETAAAAVEAIEAKGNIEGQREVFGHEYTQLFYIDSDADKTYYADLYRADNYVLAVDVTETTWSNRSVDGLSDDETRIERLLRNTWLDLETNHKEAADE